MKTRILFISILALWLTACAGSPWAPTIAPTATAAATVDSGLLETQAVATAVMRITFQAALNPSATPVVTDTLVPTETLMFTVIPLETATATPKPTAVPVYPTKTPRIARDVAVLVSAYPPDGTTFAPGEAFDARFTFNNTGPTTWGSGYGLRLSGGQKFGSEFAALGADVAPGSSGEVIVDMVAPAEAGLYVAYYEFVNSNAEIFQRVYVAITVE